MGTKTQLLLLVSAVILLSAANNNITEARVKTQFHIQKLAIGDHIETTDSSVVHFYFTPVGKRDYAAEGYSFKEERKGNVITRTSTTKLGKMISMTTTFLNLLGQEDSIVITDSTQRIWKHKFLYDKAGVMIEDRQYLPETEHPSLMISKYKVLNGNRIEESIFSSPSVDTVLMPNPVTGMEEKVVQRFDDLLMHKEYFTDKIRMPLNVNFGYPEADNGSRNLDKKWVQLSAKGDTTDVFLFRYTFDNKGRVTSQVQTSRTGEYDSTAYTYY